MRTGDRDRNGTRRIGARLPRIGRPIVVAAAALAALSPPAIGAPAWSARTTLSGELPMLTWPTLPPIYPPPADPVAPAGVVARPQLEIDASGDAVAAWVADPVFPTRTVKAAAHTPGGPWSAPVALGSGATVGLGGDGEPFAVHLGSPGAAGDDAANALVRWEDGSPVSRALPAVPPAHPLAIDWSVDENGDGIVAWVEQVAWAPDRYVVRGATLSPGSAD